jgi:hypothetical protein
MSDSDCPMGGSCVGGVCSWGGGDADGDGFDGGADCDDADPTVHPMAGERCNMRDDDCDGLVDEGCR